MGGPTVNPTVTELLVPLAEVTDRGLYQDDSFVSWADHIAAGAQLAAALRARLDPTRPPHVGALLGNTTFFSSLLVAAGLDGLVPVGLNQTRRGEALARDIAHADCQLVLADSSVTVPPGVEYIDVESADWAAELASYHGTPVRFAELSADDLFMLIFTSGTGGDPKAVRVTHDKVAFPGRMLAERFGLGPADTVYLSMPLFHSNAIMAGWAVAAAAGASIALRRKFSASGFMPDIRRFGATYANYVGKPLSYILASEPAPDDADNPLRILYGNEGSPPDLGRFAERFGVTVETGQACPPGVVGELVNPTGAGWFRGYYNDPDAEAARMTGGVYHTGDLAYLDEFGYAHFAGRLGDWMRVDGENLGTAPIERILLRYPGVAEVAVYPIPDPNVGDQVMAALVLGADTAFEAEKFRAFLHEQPDLGPKQWPSYVRIGAALPRTETFKVIKRQLSAEGTDCADPVWPISR
ncbi:long-chain-fatty-acid--CoA ligase [Mycolicibacterium sp. CBMA 295]|uniref:long-chain-fatty-acid--CoA ligase n=1 Tax=Mycolicibacterium sp. CBMA 295 TaxID=2606605 RepID=UPI0012DD782D|nr:long-chain-fatty-acid--CoA ligase [Mycolicibacterium sp. CBMA 295]MUM27908.1 AMP-binding protein [Mycolicibacterium sp. CBMA 295]